MNNANIVPTKSREEVKDNARTQAIIEMVNSVIMPGYNDISYLSRQAKVKPEELIKILTDSGKYLNPDEKGLIWELKDKSDLRVAVKNSFYDKMGQTRDFMGKYPIFYDRNGLYWLWNKNACMWEIVDETDLLIVVSDDEPGKETHKSKEKQEIMECIRQEGRRNIPKECPKTWVQFQDKIIDFATGKTFDSSPEYHVTNPIPWKIGKTSDTPTMDRIFEEWVGTDHVETLYEIISYCMLPDYPLHRIFCFVGAGSNGKSKYMELITRFVGQNNSVNTDLDVLLDSRFESAKLYKKLVCMMGETNYSSMKKTSRLKRLTGQDLIGYEFKNKTPFDDYNYAKILISTNGLPQTEDKSTGFYRRWMIIDFPNTFSEKKDILSEIPDEEYENLAKRCIDTLKHILEVREFTLEGSLEERKKKYEDTSDPLQKFIDLFVKRNINDYVAKYEFRDAFFGWMNKSGYREWNESELGISMKNKGYEEKKRSFGENRWMAWMGISLKTVQGVQTVQTISLGSRVRESKSKPLDTLDSLDTHIPKPITRDEIVNLIEKIQMSDESAKTSKIIMFCVPMSKGKVKETLLSLKEEGLIHEVQPDHWRKV